MQHMSIVAAEAKATSLIKLLKNQSNILKLLPLKNFTSSILIFEVFERNVRHRIHYISDNEAENKI